MNFESGRESLQGKDVAIVYGKNDPFLENSQFESVREGSSKLGITPQYVSFDGGHEIEEKTLLNFLFNSCSPWCCCLAPLGRQ